VCHKGGALVSPHQATGRHLMSVQLVDNDRFATYALANRASRWSSPAGQERPVSAVRVLRAYLRDEAGMQTSDLAPSVDSHHLSSIGVSKTKTITVFDNIRWRIQPVDATH
jgi:hypothetical protein